jgi:hypothetical protein
MLTLGSAALVATLTTGLFAGGALYVTLAEHPARLAAGAGAGLRQWRPSYQRAARVQAPLAIIAALAALACWADGGGGAWLVTALAMGAIVIFTLVAIAPVNRALRDERLGDSAAALALLERWGALHAVRTIVSLAAFAIDLALLAG